MHCLGLPPVHTIGGTATVITTRGPEIADGGGGGAAAPMKLIAADESHSETESDSRAGRLLRLTPAIGGVASRVVNEEVDSSYSSSSEPDFEPPAVGGAEVESAAVRREARKICESDSSDSSRYDAHRRQRRQSPAKKRKLGDGSGGAAAASSDGSGGVAAACTTRVQPPRQERRTTQPPEADQDPAQARMINEGWTRYQSGGRHLFALGKWWTLQWEAPATKTPHKAAPKHLAQAAKGRPKQTATDQQQKTTTGPAQTTKATVPERYQDETQAEVQELVRLNRVIMEERRKRLT